MSEATIKALLREVEELKAARIRDAMERAADLSAARAELDNLRNRVTALADEWEQAMGPRVLIDRDGTCDGCGEWKEELVASYPTPDSEPWLCQECDDDGRREIIELRAIVRGSDDEAGEDAS